MTHHRQDQQRDSVRTKRRDGRLSGVKCHTALAIYSQMSAGAWERWRWPEGWWKRKRILFLPAKQQSSSSQSNQVSLKLSSLKNV